jgi:hypothetical protein
MGLIKASSQEYDDKKQEFINAQIEQKRKDSPDKVTDEEIALICRRSDYKNVINDVFQCVTRQASEEQLADVMEKYLPVFDYGKNIWATFYANVADAKEDDKVADKIIKAVALWGKRDFYRYKQVADFYAEIIKPEKLDNIVSASFKPEHRKNWFDRPEQAALMIKSANNLLTECSKEEDRFHEYGFYEFKDATDKLLEAVYRGGVSTSASLAKATEELLQTSNQIKRVHLERDIAESMEEFKLNFPNYKPISDEKTPKNPITR